MPEIDRAEARAIAEPWQFQSDEHGRLAGCLLAALDELDAQAAEITRLEAKLATIGEAASTRLDEISGDTTTYEQAFRKCEILAGALTYIQREAAQPSGPAWFAELTKLRAIEAAAQAWKDADAACAAVDHLDLTPSESRSKRFWAARKTCSEARDILFAALGRGRPATQTVREEPA